MKNETISDFFVAVIIVLAIIFLPEPATAVKNSATHPDKRDDLPGITDQAYNDELIFKSRIVNINVLIF